jgi:phenylacetate-CoA ligase
MIWNEEFETMPRAAIETLQTERLKSTIARLYARVPFYTSQLDRAGIGPESITSVHDLARLPFTVKSDLRDYYPFGLFAVPMDEVLRIHASSGTTGKPTVVGYTRADIRTWAEVCARCFALSGARPGEMFQNAYGYGLFTGGLGMHYGAELMGLSTIPVSGGNTARQLLLLQDFGPQIMACTPSYSLTLADRILDGEVDRGKLNLKVFILGAEPWTPEMRTELEERLGVNAVNIYGLSEIIGPGVSNECVEAKDGSHIFEDHFIPEIIDPESGDVLPDGEEGELVLTTLSKEAFALLRYRTGDLCSLNREPCRCGRTHVRMSPVVGRSDDMLIIRGVNVFPSQIESAIVALPQLSAHYRLVVSRRERLDHLALQVEIDEKLYQDIGSERFEAHGEKPVEVMTELEQHVHNTLREALGLNTPVSLLAPGQGPRSQGGKLSRVQDLR